MATLRGFLLREKQGVDHDNDVRARNGINVEKNVEGFAFKFLQEVKKTVWLRLMIMIMMAGLLMTMLMTASNVLPSRLSEGKHEVGRYNDNDGRLSNDNVDDSI